MVSGDEGELGGKGGMSENILRLPLVFAYCFKVLR
jgi:hypothetical protein